MLYVVGNTDTPL